MSLLHVIFTIFIQTRINRIGLIIFNRQKLMNRMIYKALFKSSS